MALSGIEGPLQQRAEDGRFHVLPFGTGRKAENIELSPVQREGLGRFEEAAIEAKHVLAKNGGEAATIHGSPERFDHRLEIGKILSKAFEQLGKALARKKVDVFGEEGEDAAHQKRRDCFGGVILF